MPRSKEQNDKIKQEKRERILQVAIGLFARNGFNETTVAKVAKEAGVSFGSVFTYFPSKEELFAASVVEPIGLLRDRMMYKEGQYEGSPLAQIKQMVAQQVHWFAHQGSYLRLIQYVLGQPERFPDLFAELDQFLADYKSSMQPLIEQGQACGELQAVPHDVISVSYLGFLNGIRLTIVDAPDQRLWEQFTEQGIRLFAPVAH